MITDQKSKKKIKDDLDWIQDEMFAKPCEQREFYDNIDEKDNKVTIEKFCNLKKGEKNGKQQAPYFTEDLRKKIEKKLKELYHVQ